MFLGQHMPEIRSLRRRALSFGEMFKDVGILGALIVCYLLALFFAESRSRTVRHGDRRLRHRRRAADRRSAIITKFSIGSFLLFVLFITHALVGAVELGTDGWIQNITGNLFTSEQGKYLFIWTSAIMFGLRFCANFIEKRLRHFAGRHSPHLRHPRLRRPAIWPAA